MPELLIVTAVEAEATAVLAGLADAGLPTAEQVSIGPYAACRLSAQPEVIVLAGGIGPAAAAAAAGAALALLPAVGLIVSAGIAGGFGAAGVGVGDVVLASSSVFADLGADSPAGFRSAAELGWGSAPYPGVPGLLHTVADQIRSAGLSVHLGPVLTVSTVTGTAARAAALADAHGPVAEAMEGAAVAAAAARFDRGVLELRTVSNLVGDRDRDDWDIAGALASLRAGISAACPLLIGAPS